MSPGDDVFTDADLEPGPAPRRAEWRDRLERLAVVVSVGAAGLWVGGLIALGVVGGVEVFATLPQSLAIEAQAAALQRFDGVALGCAAVLLACEMARTGLGLRRGRQPAGRVRRLCALALGICAVYLALIVTPATTELQTSGVLRGVGPHGAELERLERRGLNVRRVTLPLAALLVALQIWTLRGRRDDDEEQAEQAVGPLPPGPRAGPSGPRRKASTGHPPDSTPPDEEEPPTSAS